jgi:DNA-binding transcriptional ArsR family regulator
MGLTKSTKFSIEQNRIAELAKAFAHPARVAILQHLIKIKSCVCGDIVEVLPLSQSTVSQHLKELKKAGIIQGNVEGPSVCYCIDPKICREAQLLLGSLIAQCGADGCC